MAAEFRNNQRTDDIVSINSMDSNNHGNGGNWPAVWILPVACVTGAAIWSLVIFAGLHFF